MKHIDLCQPTMDYIAKFIEKSLANPRPEGGELYSRWNEDGSESTDPHAKINIALKGDKFTVEPYFCDEDRQNISDKHANTRPRVVLISGPAIQTDEYTFVVDPDYFGEDPKRMWTGITLCLEADGDENFKPAVQELVIH